MSPEAFHNELTRRHFLSRAGAGIGAAALATLLNPRLLSAAHGEPHFAPKARRIIWLTQAGAPSQLDLFDYKPGLASQFDKDLPESVRNGQRLTGMTAGQKRFPVAPSVFKFQQHGQSGHVVERAAAAHGEVRRRDLPHPLAAHRGDQSRPGDDAAANRSPDRRAALVRRVGLVRPGLGELRTCRPSS